MSTHYLAIGQSLLEFLHAFLGDRGVVQVQPLEFTPALHKFSMTQAA